MAVEREASRDWHRLFGLLLTDFFTGSPFTVEVERDLSEQQQLLDVVIVRRGRGRFAGRLPDGLEGLAAHNLITFKSHREALDGWAVKELIGHYVAYRKLVSPSPSELLPEDGFRLLAVCARFPHNLSGQVPWQRRQAGVYDCQWGTDVVRVVVAGELPRQAHNAPLHLFSASPELVGFGQSAYRRRSANTSLLLERLFERAQAEGFVMAYTMEDFKRDYIKDHCPLLTPEEQREALQRLSPEHLRELLQALPPQELLRALPPQQRVAGLAPEDRLAGLSAEQIRQYLERLTTGRPSRPGEPRRKR
jgi:hypothetical protein